MAVKIIKRRLEDHASEDMKAGVLPRRWDLSAEHEADGKNCLPKTTI